MRVLLALGFISSLSIAVHFIPSEQAKHLAPAVGFKAMSHMRGDKSDSSSSVADEIMLRRMHVLRARESEDVSSFGATECLHSLPQRKTTSSDSDEEQPEPKASENEAGPANSTAALSEEQSTRTFLTAAEAAAVMAARLGGTSGTRNLRGSYDHTTSAKRLSHEHSAYDDLQLVTRQGLGSACESKARPFGGECHTHFTPAMLKAAHERVYGYNTRIEREGGMCKYYRLHAKRTTQSMGGELVLSDEHGFSLLIHRSQLRSHSICGFPAAIAGTSGNRKHSIQRLYATASWTKSFGSSFSQNIRTICRTDAILWSSRSTFSRTREWVGMRGGVGYGGDCEARPCSTTWACGEELAWHCPSWNWRESQWFAGHIDPKFNDFSEMRICVGVDYENNAATTVNGGVRVTYKKTLLPHLSTSSAPEYKPIELGPDEKLQTSKNGQDIMLSFPKLDVRAPIDGWKPANQNDAVGTSDRC
eukprot:2989007-Pleurochrysis_carterae.AAC.4